MLDFLPVEIVKYILNIYLDYENVVPFLSEIINFTFDVDPHIKEEIIGDSESLEYSIIKYLDGTIIYKKTESRYPENYLISEITNYKNGIKNGLYEKYANGKIEESCTYLNGEINGIFYEYNIPDPPEIDSISIQTEYKNGECTGECRTYLLDGSIYQRYQNLDGNINGELIRYYHPKEVEGKLEVIKLKETYVDGTLTGLSYLYHKNGNIARILETCNCNNLNFYDINGIEIKEKDFIKQYGHIFGKDQFDGCEEYEDY